MRGDVARIFNVKPFFSDLPSWHPLTSGAHRNEMKRVERDDFEPCNLLRDTTFRGCSEAALRPLQGAPGRQSALWTWRWRHEKPGNAWGKTSTTYTVLHLDMPLATTSKLLQTTRDHLNANPLWVNLPGILQGELFPQLKAKTSFHPPSPVVTCFLKKNNIKTSPFFPWICLDNKVVFGKLAKPKELMLVATSFGTLWTSRLWHRWELMTMTCGFNFVTCHIDEAAPQASRAQGSRARPRPRPGPRRPRGPRLGFWSPRAPDATPSWSWAPQNLTFEENLDKKPCRSGFERFELLAVSSNSLEINGITWSPSFSHPRLSNQRLKTCWFCEFFSNFQSNCTSWTGWTIYKKPENLGPLECFVVFNNGIPDIRYNQASKVSYTHNPRLKKT